MAFSAARTSKGFEWRHNLSGSQTIVRNLIAQKNAAIAQGDYLVLTAGSASKAAANATLGLGAAQEAVASATTQDVDVIINPDAVYCCSFDAPLTTYGDQAVASATAGNAYIGLTTQLGTDDYGIGAYCVVYAGSDKGKVYVVYDYDDAGGNVTAELILDRPHAMSTTSYVYILGDVDSGTGTYSIGPGSLVDLADENTLDADLLPSSGGFRVLGINGLDGTLNVTCTDHAYGIV